MKNLMASLNNTSLPMAGEFNFSPKKIKQKTYF